MRANHYFIRVQLVKWDMNDPTASGLKETALLSEASGVVYSTDNKPPAAIVGRFQEIATAVKREIKLPPAQHHPGTDAKSHPVSECEQRGCHR